MTKTHQNRAGFEKTQEEKRQKLGFGRSLKTRKTEREKNPVMEMVLEGFEKMRETETKGGGGSGGRGGRGPRFYLKRILTKHSPKYRQEKRDAAS